MTRLICIAGAVAALALGVAGGSAGATTVAPAGATVTGVNVLGPMVFSIPFVGSVRCAMTMRGVIPAGQNNPNVGGSVTTTVETPRFSGCTTSFGMAANVTTSATFGTWTLTAMALAGGPTVLTLAMPRVGMLIELREAFFNCVINSSYSGNTPLTGVWSAGTATVAFTGQQSSLSQSGLSCPPPSPIGTMSGTVALTTPGATVTIGGP